jgi:uncharacterized membrane protein
MAKLIFQVGLLAFFISAVAFGLQDYPLFDVILRAFIVCVGVILISVVMVFVFAWAGNKPVASPAETPASDGLRAGGAHNGTAAHTTATEPAKAD